jgi:AcrR family transcriptional regulator
MARVRAEDYDDKRQGILDAAAVLFAQAGYANVKMADVARACGASKSMLYHYFSKKEDVLFEIMREQVQSYLDATEEVVARPAAPEVRLREFVAMWITRATQARARITVLMYEYKFLPRRQRTAVSGVARRLIDRVAGLVSEVSPELVKAGPSHVRTCTLLLFGLLNWTEVWYRSTGPLGPGEMADVIFRLFLDGVRTIGPAGSARAARP